MKTFRIIQRVAAGAGMLESLKMADNLQPSDNELIGSMALVVVCCLSFISEVFYKEHNA